MQRMRTALFVPATHPERIDKALASGADEVIVDLEDAVVPDQKDAARQNLRGWLETATASVFVRINAVGQPGHEADAALCRACERVKGVLLPKAESGRDIASLNMRGKRIWPIIETAAGLSKLAEIAAAEGVERLAAGFLDLSLDMGWTSGSAGAEAMCDQVRYAIVLQSRVSGLQQPVDGVFPDIGDIDGLRRAATKSRDVGFAGMLTIHPRQIAIIHAALQPSAAEIAWAERIVAVAKDSRAGAFALDGMMVDAPVVARAERILALCSA